MQNDMAEQQRGKRGEKVRFLFCYSKGYRIRFITALAATLLSTVFSFLTPQVIKVTIDSVIDSNPYQLPVKLALWLEQVAPREYLRENLWIPAVVTILFALFSTLTNFQRRYNIALFAEGTIRNLRNQLFNLTQRLPYEWHIRIQTGDIIQRCTSDLNTIQAFLSQQLIELIRVIVMIVVASYMMISIHMKLALAALAFLPFIAGYSVFFFKKAGDRFLMADEAEG
ncbi:MAG: ABC transporter ATP-binding protein, partial [Clostridia bacterium]|nr:ABC transporter ATP-binding protein [Clostridia bacterium]